ncbi:MAG TPA: class I SAM-dependent methyltransferase [Allosphingosinicella sp.]|nr:class I SAM-dependent methyltransferase [Allosphingosinicella sp.]
MDRERDDQPASLGLEAVANLYDMRAGLFHAEEQIADVRNAVALVRSVCPAPDSRILDLGCGEGQHLIELRAAGYLSLHGIDISSRAVEIARRRCQALPISFTCGNVADLDMGEFDLVTAFNSSLGSLGAEGDRSYLRGVAKALRPGGLFVLCHVSLDSAQRRVGTFYSRSARDEGGYITTRVSISEDNRWLRLRQNYMSHVFPSEQIRIFGEEELSAMMDDVGLERAGVTVDHSRSLPYVGVFLARKR